MLEVKNLSVSLEGKPFFDNVSFYLAQGKLHFLRGKNGIGKSTLFRALSGDLSSNFCPEGIRYVTQDAQQMISGLFTFEENLQFAALDPKPSLWKRPVSSVYMPSFIQAFGIQRKTPGHLLSGGQKQILSLVMALQKPTKILLLDEPTAALDAANSHIVMSFLRQLTEKEGITVFVICHDDEIIRTYATGSILTLIDHSGFKTFAEGFVDAHGLKRKEEPRFNIMSNRGTM